MFHSVKNPETESQLKMVYQLRNIIISRQTLLAVFIMIMFSANVYLVSYESIVKYLNGGIMIEVSTRSSEGLEAPAVTICRSGSDDM